MKLLQNISDVKDFVAVQANIDWQLLEPYLDQAERKYVTNLIGNDTLNTIVAGNSDDIKTVRKLFSGAVANMGVLMALPVLNLKISNIGATVTENSNTKQPEWWQLKDLKRTLQKFAYDSIDMALAVMEKSSDFADWKNTEYYTEIKDVLVWNADIFDRYFPIKKSRQTFIGLKPFLLEVEEEFIKPLFDENTYEQIKAADDGIVKKVLKNLQAAEVSFVVAKVVSNTTFELTPTGLFLRWDELPGEKVKPIDIGKLQAFAKEKEVAGNEYLKKAIKIIEENPAEFPNYEKKQPAVIDRINKQNSFLGL